MLQNIQDQLEIKNGMKKMEYILLDKHQLLQLIINLNKLKLIIQP